MEPIATVGPSLKIWASERGLICHMVHSLQLGKENSFPWPYHDIMTSLTWPYHDIMTSLAWPYHDIMTSLASNHPSYPDSLD